MAIVMVVVYLKYSRFRLSSADETKAMLEKYEKLEREMLESERRFSQDVKNESNKVQSLLREIDDLRKEKENEIKLRLNAEKQIELTLQKVHDLERMIDDWQVMQDAVMSDCKDAMFKIGNDLYKKLHDSYKQEVETNKNLFGKISKNITELMEKSAAPAVAMVEAGPHVVKTHEEKPAPQAKTHVDENTKKMVADLAETMNAAGRMVNKDYFLPANFDEQKAKLMLCELAFQNSGKLYLLDFKACRYVREYEVLKQKNEAAAKQNLAQKFERYLAYLSNPKYRDSILKALQSSKVKFEKLIIISLIPQASEVKILKDLGYIAKAQKQGIEILDFNEVNNIVL